MDNYTPGITFDNLRDSVKVGDIVQYLKRSKVSDKLAWVVDARVVKKYPYMMKVRYYWDGVEETNTMSYPDYLMWKHGNFGMPTTSKIGHETSPSEYLDPVSPEAFVKALTKPVR